MHTRNLATVAALAAAVLVLSLATGAASATVATLSETVAAVQNVREAPVRTAEPIDQFSLN